MGLNKVIGRQAVLELALAGVWVVAALLFRLWQLEQVPPGLHYDEAIDLRQGLRVAAGARPLYVAEGWGREALFFYLVALVLKVVPNHLLGLRLTTALCGTAVIVLAYLIGRRLAGRLAGWFTAGWLAVTFWSVSTGRVGVRNITLPLMLGLAVLAFWWALAQPGSEGTETAPARRWRYLAAGALLGLTLYTYQPARLMPFIFVAFALYLYGVHRPVFRANRSGLILFGLTAAAVALPLILFLNSQPSGEADRAWTVEPLTALMGGNLQPVWANTLATAGMFSLRGDPLMAQNIPGRPVFVPGWTSLFFYAGLALAVWRWRRPAYGFMLIWLVVALLPTILTISAPHYNRTIAAQTPVMLLAALPIGEAGAVARRRRWAGVVPVVAGLVALSATGLATWRDYFDRWPADPGVAFQYSASITAVARYLEEAGGDRPAVISSLGFENTDPYIVSAILDKDDEMRRWLHAGEALAIPANSQHSLLIIARDQWLNPELAAFFDVPAEPLLASSYFTVYDLMAPRWPSGSGLPAHALAAGLPWPAPESSAAPLSWPVSFQERVRLESIQLLTPTPRPGSTLALLTTWQVEQNGQPASLALFVHLLDAAGQLVAQQDGLGYPPHSWRAGDQFANAHYLQLDSTLPAGPYWLQMGLYRRDTGERWLLVDGENRPLGDRLLLGPIEVGP